MMHIACNNMWTTLDKITFSFFDDVLGASPGTQTQHISLGVLYELVS